MITRRSAGIVLVSIGAICGFAAGLVTDRVAFFVLDRAVSVIELFNLVLVLVIALAVPLFLTRRIGDSRVKKNLVIDELKQFVVAIQSLASELTNSDDTVLARPEFLVQKTLFFKACRVTLEMVCKEIPDNRNLRMKDVCIAGLEDYWEYVTGANGIGGTPESRFRQKQDRIAAKLQLKAKKLMYEVNDL